MGQQLRAMIVLPEFNSQHLHGGSRSSIAPVVRALTPSSSPPPHTHTVHMNKQNTYTQKINLEKNFNFAWALWLTPVIVIGRLREDDGHFSSSFSYPKL